MGACGWMDRSIPTCLAAAPNNPVRCGEQPGALRGPGSAVEARPACLGCRAKPTPGHVPGQTGCMQRTPNINARSS